MGNDEAGREDQSREDDELNFDDIHEQLERDFEKAKDDSETEGDPAGLKLATRICVEQFAVMSRETFRFVARVGWFGYTGVRWRSDPEGLAVEQAARFKLPEKILKRANRIKDEKKRAAVVGIAMSAATIKAPEQIVRASRSSLAEDVLALDSHKFLLNTPTHTIELDKGALPREHRWTDFITQTTNADYVPEAGAPQWEAFLLSITNDDADFAEALQRWFGYCLSGDTHEQYMAILYGPGANGKSVLWEVIAEVIGEYAVKASDELMRMDSHLASVAQLRGSRLVVINETQQGLHACMNRIKQLTGDEMLTARFMHGNLFEFRRTFKPVLVTNHLPRISDSSEGAWRRVMLFRFERIFRGDEIDKALKDKLLRESSGILNWLLEGFRLWREHGLLTTKPMREATAAYRSEEDAIGSFIDDALVLSGEPEDFIAVRALRKAFENWAEDMGYKASSPRSFNQRLEAVSADTGKRIVRAQRWAAGKNVRVWEGLRLV